MNGVLATDLIEISSDPNCLSDGGFWAVSSTFEGQYTFAKFRSVAYGIAFPDVGQWLGLQEVWKSSMSQPEYEEYVSDIRGQIELGNVYQVNACRILTTKIEKERNLCLLYTSPSPRDRTRSRMPSSA